MKSTPSIKGFLTTKKLLDQDKKALSKDASQKSLSRASVRLKNFEDVLDGRTPTRNNFQELAREQEVEDILRPARPVNNEQQNYRNYDAGNRENGSPQYRQSNRSRVAEPTKEGSVERAYKDERKNLWAGISNIDGSFSSSRQESRQALQSLSRRIDIQIKVFNNSIDDYRGRLKRTFEIQYERLREYVHDLVEKTFRKFEQEMKQAFFAEEARLNRKVYETRKDLEQLQRSVDDMKEGLEGPQWKKIAGQILSSDFLMKGELTLEEAAEKLVLADLQLGLAPSKKDSLNAVLNDLVRLRIERRPADGLVRLA